MTGRRSGANRSWPSSPKMTGAPVALIPSGSKGPFAAAGYDLYDPALDCRRPVDEGLSRKVVPIAWMFYRTLPDHSLGLADLLRFSLPGVARETRLVLVLAVRGACWGSPCRSHRAY